MANIYVEKKELIYVQSMKSFWSALTTQDWPRLSHIHFPKSSALNNGLTCLVHLRITCLNLISVTCLNLISVPTFWSRPQAKELLRLKQHIQIKIFDKYGNSTDLGHELKIYTTKIHGAVCVNDHYDTHVWNM